MQPVSLPPPIKIDGTAESRFKLVVFSLVYFGFYPSPGRIERWLGHHVRHNLNGRECKWREEVLTSFGWTHKWSPGGLPAWQPPYPFSLVRDCYGRWEVINAEEIT
jgi:hypothetical protein